MFSGENIIVKSERPDTLKVIFSRSSLPMESTVKFPTAMVFPSATTPDTLLSIVSSIGFERT